MTSDSVDQQGPSIMDSESADRQGLSSGPSWNRVFLFVEVDFVNDIFIFQQTNIKCLAHRGNHFCTVLVEF